MPLFGAHMSIAGGFHKAVDAAATLGMETVQIFTASPSQWSVAAADPAVMAGTRGQGWPWRSKPLSDDDIRRFRETIAATGLRFPIGHNSYLINLASPNPALWERSLAALLVELERAEALGLVGLVMHPGSFVASTEAEGIERIVAALDELHRRTAGFQILTLLETTAGQGTNLGHRFEHLQQILNRVAEPDRLGVCVDTCHIFAAGYPLDTAEEYAATMSEFDERIGLERIKAFHLNDSVKGLGSRVDRHARIGGGCLGLEPFRHLVNDPRFSHLPMYLETPKGVEEGEPLDAMNLRILRGLMKPAGVRRRQ